MAGYSDAQIAQFLRINPSWKPPVEENRFRVVCDELSHCRCYCTMCSKIVLNLRHNVEWSFSSNTGIAHSCHDDEKTCYNNACMFSIQPETHSLASTMVKQPKKYKKTRKHKNNFNFDLKGEQKMPPKSNLRVLPCEW